MSLCLTENHEISCYAIFLIFIFSFYYSFISFGGGGGGVMIMYNNHMKQIPQELIFSELFKKLSTFCRTWG